MSSGKFITFEGGDCAGKSTQLHLLAEQLASIEIDVKTTREPGGSPGAEMLRELLLSGKAKSLGVLGEALLFSAARADHISKFIRPRLRHGNWVLCDRYTDSSKVYQGGPDGVDEAVLDQLSNIATGGLKADLTFILDLPVATVLDRMARRDDNQKDRFERDGTQILERRRQSFLSIAQEDPQRCALIDATQNQEAVSNAIWKVVNEKFPQLGMIQ